METFKQAKLVMDDPNATREQVQAAYDALASWHAEHHLAACACPASLVLETLKFDLLVWVDGVPRKVGTDRVLATSQLLAAILGK